MYGPPQISSDLELLGIWYALDAYKIKISKYRFLQNMEFFGGSTAAVISTVVFAYYDYPTVILPLLPCRRRRIIWELEIWKFGKSSIAFVWEC